MTPTQGMPAGMDRRQLLRRAGLTALLAGPGISMLGACATSGGNDDEGKDVTADQDPVNPFGVDGNAPLEVVIFKGGLDDAYATQAHEPAYAKKFPDAKITHTATQKIAQTQRPRYQDGSPADMVNLAGDDLIEPGELVQDGQLMDLTPLFDAPAIGAPEKTVRETLVEGMDMAGQIDGKPYALSYVMSIYGLWYDAKLFEKEGWTPPRNFTEFKQFCEQAKAKDMVPYAYAGKNASYYQMWMIMITAAKIGGNQVLIDIDNLEDDAWRHDAVKQSAQAWADICTTYTPESYQGLEHTEVQTQQNQGKVALYPSGSWLENEQKKDTPKGFQYAMAPTPSVSDADQMPYEAIRAAAGEFYTVSTHGKNPEGGMEYLRIMLSMDGARQFTETTGSMTIVDGAADGLDLPPGLQSAREAQKAAGENIVVDNKFEGWYGELNEAIQKEVDKLMFGRISVDEFIDNCQNEADKIKNDSSVIKSTRV